ncbi:MAG: pseudouridine synthase [Polyangiales bacterium]
MNQERLQKVLARAGIASRRHAEELIVAGHVRVNGRVVTELGMRVDPHEDKVEVDGRRIVLESPVYAILHKPRGVVTTLSDPEGRPTIAESVKSLGARVFPVGRLDFHTSGALLITNDGALSQALLHPRQHVPKVYVAKIRGVPSDAQLDAWRNGVVLPPTESDPDERPTKTLPAEVRVLRQGPPGEDSTTGAGATWIQVTLREGRTRQIHRMADATGLFVMRLVRISFADITTEGLRPGELRELTEKELTALRVRFLRPVEQGAFEGPTPDDFEEERPKRAPRRAEGERPARASAGERAPRGAAGERAPRREPAGATEPRGPRRETARAIGRGAERVSRDGGARPFEGAPKREGPVGARRDDRGPRRDDRGPAREARGPARDDRGPAREARGPARDDRGPRGADRGPKREAPAGRFGSGPRRDDRGPAREERAPRGADRGPARETRGPARDDRGPKREGSAGHFGSGPRRDERGPARETRGPARETRGPAREEGAPKRGASVGRYGSGPKREESAPRRDDRGPARDARGPARDDRGPRREVGPSRETRGPARDERGPKRDARGADDRAAKPDAPRGKPRRKP